MTLVLIVGKNRYKIINNKQSKNNNNIKQIKLQWYSKFLSLKLSKIYNIYT